MIYKNLSTVVVKSFNSSLPSVLNQQFYCFTPWGLFKFFSGFHQISLFSSNIHVHAATSIFPFISDFTGLNAIGPRTSEQKNMRNVVTINFISCADTHGRPKKGTISPQAWRKGSVGMSSPSDTITYLYFASENSVIVQQLASTIAGQHHSEEKFIRAISVFKGLIIKHLGSEVILQNLWPESMERSAKSKSVSVSSDDHISDLDTEGAY